MQWLASHADLIAFGLYAVASVVGAVLPGEHPVGQWCRRLAADLANKNLDHVPGSSAVGGGAK